MRSRSLLCLCLSLCSVSAIAEEKTQTTVWNTWSLGATTGTQGTGLTNKLSVAGRGLGSAYQVDTTLGVLAGKDGQTAIIGSDAKMIGRLHFNAAAPVAGTVSTEISSDGRVWIYPRADVLTFGTDVNLLRDNGRYTQIGVPLPGIGFASVDSCLTVGNGESDWVGRWANCEPGGWFTMLTPQAILFRDRKTGEQEYGGGGRISADAFTRDVAGSIGVEAGAATSARSKSVLLAAEAEGHINLPEAGFVGLGLSVSDRIVKRAGEAERDHEFDITGDIHVGGAF